MSCKYGFDLTDFGDAGTFKRVLGVAEIPRKARVVVENAHYGTRDFIWRFYFEGDNILIQTYCDPISGQDQDGQMRRPGYAGYIGIEGDANKVAALVCAIKEYAVSVKGESPDQRDFI
jgi:hypothetical protein